jgi:hypothetical protein
MEKKKDGNITSLCCCRPNAGQDRKDRVMFASARRVATAFDIVTVRRTVFSETPHRFAKVLTSTASPAWNTRKTSQILKKPLSMDDTSTTSGGIVRSFFVPVNCFLGIQQNQTP